MCRGPPGWCSCHSNISSFHSNAQHKLTLYFFVCLQNVMLCNQPIGQDSTQDDAPCPWKVKVEQAADDAMFYLSFAHTHHNHDLARTAVERLAQSGLRDTQLQAHPQIKEILDLLHAAGLPCAQLFKISLQLAQKLIITPVWNLRDIQNIYQLRETDRVFDAKQFVETLQEREVCIHTRT